MQLLLSIGCKPYITNCCKEFYLKVPRSVFQKAPPCTKTSPVLCENQPFFLLFRNVATFIESHCVFLCFFFYFSQYDEVFWSVFCYHYLVSVDPVNGCLNSKLLVKECNFLLSSIFSPLVDIQLKRLKPLCWAYPWVICFRVNW